MVDEVILPYVSARKRVEGGPTISVAITPANLKINELGSGDTAYRLTLDATLRRTSPNGSAAPRLWCRCDRAGRHY
jgi:hypothetical protein